MEVQRHPEPLGGGVEVIELRRVGQGVPGAPVQHRATEAQLGDRALQFLSGSFRRGRRDGGKGLEALRIAVDDLGEGVVRLACDGHGVLCRKVLHAGRGEGQDLDVDALVVHVGQAPIGDVPQPLGERLVAVAELGDLRHPRQGPSFEQHRQDDVLLESYDPRCV